MSRKDCPFIPSVKCRKVNDCDRNKCEFCEKYKQYVDYRNKWGVLA